MENQGKINSIVVTIKKTFEWKLIKSFEVKIWSSSKGNQKEFSWKIKKLRENHKLFRVEKQAVCGDENLKVPRSENREVLRMEIQKFLCEENHLNFGIGWEFNPVTNGIPAYIWRSSARKMKPAHLLTKIYDPNTHALYISKYFNVSVNTNVNDRNRVVNGTYIPDLNARVFLYGENSTIRVFSYGNFWP